MPRGWGGWRRRSDLAPPRPAAFLLPRGSGPGALWGERFSDEPPPRSAPRPPPRSDPRPVAGLDARALEARDAAGFAARDAAGLPAGCAPNDSPSGARGVSAGPETPF